LVLLILSSVDSIAQFNFTQNPFLKEEGFFTSDFEKQTFQEYLSGKAVDEVNLFLALNSSGNLSKVKEVQGKIYDLSNLLLHKRHKHTTELSFLYRVFNGIQTRQLVKYEKYSTFQSLMNGGTYDCLTATALYAIILKKMNYSLEVKETAAHSYLVVNVDGKKVLFESTDREDGFVSDYKAVKEKELKYARQTRPGDENFSGLSGQVSEGKSIATYSQSINITQLAGLHYYNQAVVAYNNKNFKTTVNTLEKAYMLYPSKRIFTLLITSIHEVLRSPNITNKEIKRYSAKTRYYTMNSEDWQD